MAIQVGRRIIFDKITGAIIFNTGEMQGDMPPREVINELDFIDLPFGQDSDKFMRAKVYHVDPITKEVVFDELVEPTLTPEQQIAELQQQLLQAQGVI